MISRAPSKSCCAPGATSESGFSLIELLMVLILVGVLSAVSIELITDSITDARYQETIMEMQTISEAIVGNKKLRQNGTRTSFGYAGDIGAMPTGAWAAAATSLLTMPGGFTAYTVSTTTRIGYGWNGPYLEAGDSATDYTTDAFGNAYIYSAAATPPTLVSYGYGGAPGGTGLAQDITITFPADERLATVEGFVSSAGGPYALAAEAELNYPNGTTGGLTQAPDTNLSAENGHFSFTNVPFGIRSITIYRPTKAAPVQTLGPIIITVDRPKVIIPANQLDLSP